MYWTPNKPKQTSVYRQRAGTLYDIDNVVSGILLGMFGLAIALSGSDVAAFILNTLQMPSDLVPVYGTAHILMAVLYTAFAVWRRYIAGDKHRPKSEALLAFNSLLFLHVLMTVFWNFSNGGS